jgi:lysophospholipase L1-like esterase
MMQLEHGDFLLFVGDSITDAGRARDSWQGEGDGHLGQGYVNMVASLIAARYPQRTIRMVNKGISGDTIRHLANRWREDVQAASPSWLSVMIGINDVWRQFDMPGAKHLHIPLDEFERTYNECLKSVRDELKGLILLTPFFCDSNMLEPMRVMVERYASAVRRLAKRYDAILVETQGPVDELLKHYQSYRLAGDRVHPTQVGHAVLARQFLQAIGYEWH